MIPTSTDLREIQRCWQDLELKLNPFLSGNPDLSGRRITGAGISIDRFDYVTRFELDRDLKDISSRSDAAIRNTLLASVSAVRVGPFAVRGSAIAHANSLFIANDHNYVGWLSTGAVWKYAFGANALTQAGIAAVTALLGTDDAGYLIDVTDYLHQLKWSGTALAFAPGDPGSGFVSEGKPDGSAPNGGLWGLCDGSSYNVLNSAGTLTNTTTVDRTAATFSIGVVAASVGLRAAMDPPASTEVMVEGNYDANMSPANKGVVYEYTPNETNGGLPARVGVTYYIRR